MFAHFIHNLISIHGHDAHFGVYKICIGMPSLFLFYILGKI